MDMLPLLVLAPVLLVVAYCDLRFMTIPNLLSLIALAVFVATAALVQPPDLVARVAVAAVVFALGFAAFAARLVGAGDVKVLSALMLFIPLASLTVFALVFSASMLLGVVLVLGARLLRPVERAGWKGLCRSAGFPMGISIALAGLALPMVELALRVS